MKINFLTSLSESEIVHGTFPLRKLLKDSLFYPACDIDDGVIRYCNERFDTLGIYSYVYADYAVGESRFRTYIDEFPGYQLLASRPLSPSDIGADNPFPMPEGVNPEDYFRFRKDWHPFACWAVYERDPDFDDHHGPERFSLLYLGAEGAAAYSGLYVANGISPKAMAIIQPGTGFGLNWTDFRDWHCALARTVRMGKAMPEFFFYGGHGYFDYLDFTWPDYQHIDTIDHYYHREDGRVTVWKHYYR